MDKLKEEHRAELKAATNAYEQRCLLSFSTNRSGETTGQVFINHAPIMANSVHNAVLKTLQDRGVLGFVGPAYQQASQMVFAPIGLATKTPPIDPQAQGDGDVGATQPIGTTVSPQFAPMYTSSTAMTTHAQENYMTGFPVGWNLATGFGMPPEYMVSSTAGQPSSSASQPMNQQVNVSAPQPAQSQDATPAPC